MGWFVLAKLFSLLISLVHLGRLSDSEKDLEILLLRQQISILLRTHDQPVSATRFEKMTLAVIAARLKELSHRSASQLGGSSVYFNLRQFWVGTEHWSGVNGRFLTKLEAEGHVSAKKLKN